MPAIITHDRFAQEMLGLPATSFISTEEKKNAFLLGSQGPDPLFFCVVSPQLAPYRRLGSLMHDKKPADLLQAISHAATKVPSNAQGVVRAFSAGFLCHYLLDRAAHPFVYSQQYALCNAGIEGLTAKDGHEVHAVIESELDEYMLYTRTGLTVSAYKPYKEILKASDQTLAALSHALCTTFWEVYGRLSPAHLFSKSVQNYRLVQFATYSPHGVKRQIYGMVERRFRNHSFAQAFCHRPLALTESAFDNHEHRTWTNPFTGEIHTESFDGIFDKTLVEANEAIPAFMEGLSFEEAYNLTKNINFSGKVTSDEQSKETATNH